MKKHQVLTAFAASALLLVSSTGAKTRSMTSSLQSAKDGVAAEIVSRGDHYASVARQIWELAEVAGLFDDVDVVLHWHAGDRNDASPGASLANKSAKFRFHGVSTHAAAAPERGRSALDGVEAMNHMVNLLREHVPQESRIHYVITRGGLARNVVPDFAEVYYYVRNPDVETALLSWAFPAIPGSRIGSRIEAWHPKWQPTRTEA